MVTAKEVNVWIVNHRPCRGSNCGAILRPIL